MVSAAELFAEAEPPEQLGSVEVGPDGGEFTGIRSDAPITDWAHVFERFNLDPGEFEIINDTVRMSSWEQSKRLENGDRDTIRLFSYRALFRRRRNEGFSRILASQIRPVKPRKAPRVEGLPMVVCVADSQLGKDGPDAPDAETMDARFDDALARVAAIVAEHRPSQLVIADNGDPIEGITTSAPNQIATNTLSLDEQLRLWQRRLTQTILTLAPYASRTDVAAVPSNHGEIRNSAGKVGYGDYGLGVARAVRDAFSLIGTDLDLEFHFPASEHDVTTYVDVDGTRVAFTHGHHAKTRERFPQWVANQAASTRSPMRDASIVVHGHFHSRGFMESRGREIISCPHFDAGSSWFENLTGEWSRPALTVFQVRAGRVFDLRFVEPCGREP